MIPVHYAALFDQGHTWTYDVTTTDYNDAPAKTTHAKVTCKVAAVGDVPERGAVSKVTCSPAPHDAHFIDHVYYAAPDGLKLLAATDKLPTTAAGLDAAIAHVSITAAPKATRKDTKETALNPKGVISEGVRAEGDDGWCTFYDSSTADPDGSIAEQCFHAEGITSGEFHSMNKLYKITYKLHK